VPVYQYACTECGEQLEVRQSFTDDPLTVCPSCQGRLRKVLSAVGVVFKGSGFYRTDSRADAQASSNGSSSNGKSADGSSSDKPATKSASGTDGASAGSSSSTSTSASSRPSAPAPA
jgi:putative FmdB family regulatory protein